jgi:hypothetical protein
LVSPQMPIMLESSAAEATRRLRESGVTVYANVKSLAHTVEIEDIPYLHRQ